MTNLDSILKSRDFTLPTKVRIIKAMVFPVVMYGCESWTVKKAEHRRIDAFELWCWRRLLRVPWTARRSTSPFWRRSALGFLWKEWCWSWNSSPLATSCEELTHWKRPWCSEGLGQEEKGRTEDEMAGWHYQLEGHEFEWSPGVGNGQGGLACCDSWGRKETELNWTEDLAMLLKYNEHSFFSYSNELICKFKKSITEIWPVIAVTGPRLYPGLELKMLESANGTGDRIAVTVIGESYCISVNLWGWELYCETYSTSQCPE